MRRALVAPTVVAASLLLAGCAPTVSMRPAPDARSVGCAGVVVRLPASIGGADRRSTDAQGTAAWGLPASVTLTCGVGSPDVSATNCTTFGTVDWLTQARTIDGVDWRVYTTFGRSPATQVLVDPAEVSTDTALTELSDPIAAATTVTAQCLSVTGT